MTLTYCFLQKNFCDFFFRKYLQKLLTLSLHTIKSFQIGKNSKEFLYICQVKFVSLFYFIFLFSKTKIQIDYQN